MKQFPKLTVLTIEGGGVYGFSLLGQLQGVREAGMKPVAFAGTSAGAIIACLHWAGYSPTQIRDKMCALAYEKKLTSLIGSARKNADTETQFAYSDFVELKNQFYAFVESAHGAIATSTQKTSLLAWVVKPYWWLKRTIAFTYRMRSTIRQVSPHVTNRGCFAGEILVTSMDRWLREAPCLNDTERSKLPANELVTFHDFAEACERPLAPLFLPVTNVTKRSLEIACSIDPKYANWPIASTVRASAGFPVFFQPIPLGSPPNDSQYVDGGVIANYPAWVFGHHFREKLFCSREGRELAMHPWVHVGLCLGPPRHPEQDPHRGRTPLSFIKGIIGLVGGKARHELEGRLAELIHRSIEVRQPEDETDAPSSLLDIEACDEKTIKRMYDRGRAAAKSCLQNYSFDIPLETSVRHLLVRLIDQTLMCMGQHKPGAQPDNTLLQLRANVFMPGVEKDDIVWQIRYSINMDGDVDLPLTLKSFQGLVGLAFLQRLPLICNISNVRKAASEGHETNKMFNMASQDHLSKIRADRTWLASVPVFDYFAQFPRQSCPDGMSIHAVHHHPIQQGTDGAVMGILSLDAAFDYGALGLNTDPASQHADPRIRSIIDIMKAIAVELSVLFSTEYGKLKE